MNCYTLSCSDENIRAFWIEHGKRSGNKSARLAYSQEIKSLPFGLVWDYYCQKENIMQTSEWIEDAPAYEKNLDR